MHKKWIINIGTIILFSLVLVFIPHVANASGMGMHGGMMGDNSSNKSNSKSMMSSEPNVLLKEPTISKQKLNLPPILKPDKQTKTDVYYTITAQQGESNFNNGPATKTLGYNGSFLGPVIQISRGQTVHIKEVNDLNENTTFHWHGAIISGKADGGPHEPVKPGDTKNIKFKVQQPAATLWFHPHPNGETAKQVYEGLAGLLYVTDKQSSKLSIPKTYGVDDFPLIVQDRTFDSNNQFNYKKDYNADGTLGKNLLINGTLNPYINVSTNFVRLRLLDGSNARNYNFRLSGNRTMYKIAGDGSLLTKPVAIKKLQLSPGERAEIVVNTSDLKDGTNLKLIAGGMNVLTMKLGERTGNIKHLPKVLKKMSAVKAPTGKVNKEKLVLSGMGNMVNINGKKFDPSRIDIHTKQGEQQVWTIENKKQMMNMIHPFHLHGVQFRILTINGKKPPIAQRGYLDTITLNPGDKYQITFKFEKTGIYMYHCHNLEHEDEGMMGQVKVIK
ncbi:multicopper oxidase family protein [Companilactobacillus ginsenosidimutans]|uniref:Multicopper oxidase n=1 Tax=Companilactobacillus ginsenosidimutans TaxID=1007676 RepID=A0A0H4QJM8_9LACO|nr:multicopper oxidase domain-containing protein [Companilactobacillus ginsenosidimutans]AKP68132.1 multicopper oxidase [Companilactobacillus ginsenosidimutans]